MSLEEVLLSVLHVVDLFSEARHLNSNRAFCNLQDVQNNQNECIYNVNTLAVIPTTILGM